MGFLKLQSSFISSGFFDENYEYLVALSGSMIFQITALMNLTLRTFGEANTRYAAIENIYRFFGEVWGDEEEGYKKQKQKAIKGTEAKLK